MSDLQTQLRRYCDHLDEVYPTPDAAEFAPLSVPARRSRWVVSLAAAAATVVLIGVVPFLISLGSTDGDVASGPDRQTPVTSAATTGADTAPAAADPQDLVTSAPMEDEVPEPVVASSIVTGDGWTRLEVPGLVGSGEMLGLVADGDTVVAVGRAEGGCLVNFQSRTSTCTPAVWVSQDRGRSWRTIDIGDDGDEVWSVTATDNGFLAVGLNEIAADRVHGVVWTSADGITWDRRVDPVFDEAYLFDVDTVPGRIAVAGACLEGDRCPVAVWTSPDGLTWSEPVILDDWRLMPVSIAVHPEGFVVADPTGTGEVNVWRSPDGETWQQVDPGLSVMEGGRPMLAAWDRGIVLALPGYHLGQPAAVFSTDGTEWEPIVASDCTPARFSDVAATAGGFIAVGDCAGGSTAAIWASGDGTTWRLVSSDDPLFSGDSDFVAADEQGVVVIGGDSTIWIGDPSTENE